MANRPNRGWRIHGDTARARIQRRADPLEITMTLGQGLGGRWALTLSTHPPTAAPGDRPKATTTREFAEGEDRANTIAQLAASLAPQEIARTLGITS